MHQVEDLKVLFRGRRYWHTPQLDQAIAKIVNHFGDRKDIPSEFIAMFMDGIRQHGLPEGEGWNTFWEPCPVIKTTAIEVVVYSQIFSFDVPFNPNGGKFNVNKPKLQRDGKAYHSRCKEYFYINAPEGAIALPENKKLSEV